MNSQTAATNEYDQIQQLAEQGCHEQALERIEQFLKEHPDDAQAINDCGVLLFALGRCDQAVQRLQQALAEQSSPDPATLVNLAEAALAAGQLDLLVEQLPRLSGAGVFSAELAARAASALLDAGNLASAVEVLLLSQQEVPGQEVIEPMLQTIRARRPRLALVCEPDQADRLAPYQALLAPRFETRMQAGGNPAELTQLLAWCGLIVTTDNDLDLGDWRDRPRINVDTGSLSPREVNDQIVAIETGLSQPSDADSGLRLA